MNDSINTTDSDSFDVDHHVHQLLAKHRSIAAIWCIDDVKNIRPHLTDDQAWEVLQQVGDIHDAEYGITWTTLETVADDLFPAMKIKLIDTARHPNGIAGAPFDVMLFKVQRERGVKVAILFDAPDHCAVLDVTLLAAGEIAYGFNSWSGDEYEPELRRLIDDSLATNGKQS